MTDEAVNYVSHHFGVAGEGVSVSHLRIDLQPAPQEDSMHNRGGAGRPALGSSHDQPSQPYVELGAGVVLSIGSAMGGSTTLLQFWGVGHKLALTKA
jgi:hypothetical protein